MLKKLEIKKCHDGYLMGSCFDYMTPEKYNSIGLDLLNDKMIGESNWFFARAKEGLSRWDSFNSVGTWFIDDILLHLKNSNFKTKILKHTKTKDTEIYIYAQY